MTFNSSDEKKVLSGIYGKPYELVPDNRDPDWLRKACLAPIKCDILLISGHFGGVFFGEKKSPTLSLSALENLACNQGCPSIDHAQSIYLMGCNTLADKSPDSRSIDEYLHVLVQDGFPRNLAEEVVSARYLDFGLSIENRMQLAFPHARVLYGFTSKGPLGALAAPKLREALTGSGNQDERLQGAFRGTSFSITNPTSLDKELKEEACQFRSNSSSQRESVYKKTIQSGAFHRNFDQLLEHLDDPVFINTWKKYADQNQSAKLKTIAQSIEKNSETLIGIKAKIQKLKLNLNLISWNEYFSYVKSLFEDTIHSGLDYLSTDQLCAIAKSDLRLSFQKKWLTPKNSAEESYLARLSTCFKNLEDGVTSTLLTWILQTKNASTRRESLRAVMGKISASEQKDILSRSSDWSARDRSEITFHNKSPDYSVSGTNSKERDDARWTLFQALLPSFPSISACQKMTSEFETLSGLGADWNCLNQFKKSYSITACLVAANHFSNKSSEKYSAEKSDDFLFHCSDELRSERALSRSECLALTQSMLIPGNQIKQNWNCMNLISP